MKLGGKSVRENVESRERFFCFFFYKRWVGRATTGVKWAINGQKKKQEWERDFYPARRKTIIKVKLGSVDQSRLIICFRCTFAFVSKPL